MLRKLLCCEGEFSCETAFVNLLIWQDVYSNLYCIDDGILFVKSSKQNRYFRLPIGGDLAEGIEKIRNYCGGQPPVFWVQDGERLDEFRALYSDCYDFEEHRDAFDYIYSREALANLSGKKYHSKRNHISAFSKKHEWRYEPITDGNLPAVFKCADRWYTENSHRLDKYLEGERQGLMLLLSNLDLLGAKGGAIFVGEEAVAFTIGSPINNRVFDIHIEKALPDFAEGYTVINREFARRLPESVIYINREDDMGLEGLRKAKLSYKPEILLKKYYCRPKSNEEQS